MKTDFPKASRATDPETSHMAEAEITDSGVREKQAEMVLRLVKRYPGSTYRELFDKSEVAEATVFSRRLNDLREKKLVVVGEHRKCRIGKRMMQTWWPVYAVDKPVQKGLF